MKLQRYDFQIKSAKFSVHFYVLRQEKGWNGENFSEVTNNLRNSDPYMVLADFKDYRRAQHTVQELYKQKQTWNRMSLMNISNAGIFSADRSIMDYARDIWGATPVK